jgi:putative ABC transport system permease protein
VRAVFDADPVRYPGTDTNIMLFSRKYLYEATGRTLQAGTFYVEIRDPDRAGEVSAAIDALFANSDAQTRTETEKAFAASFVAMAGNLALLLNGIGVAVTFTILLVVANTMSIAVRERRTEIAVLKTLGFTSRQVMGLVVAESALIGVMGGALGIGGAQGMMWLLTHTPGIRDALSGLGLSSLSLRPLVAGLGFANAVFLGFVAGFVPALVAYRARITDMLRTV